ALKLIDWPYVEGLAEEATVVVVLTVAFAVKEVTALLLFQFLVGVGDALYWPLTLLIPPTLGVKVTLHFELLVKPTWVSVQGLPEKPPASVPEPVKPKATVPCGQPLGAEVCVLFTVAVHVDALFTDTGLGEHETVILVLSGLVSVNVVWAV